MLRLGGGIIIVLLDVQTHSYARCNESRDIMVDQYSVKNGLLYPDIFVLDATEDIVYKTQCICFF